VAEGALQSVWNLYAGLASLRAAGSTSPPLMHQEVSTAAMRTLRLVPNDTQIQFMRGRFAGVITSAVLSTLSIVLFFYPGLNLGVDFRGGIVAELQIPAGTTAEAIRTALAPLGFGDITVQQFGSADDVLAGFHPQEQRNDVQDAFVAQLKSGLPGAQLRRLDIVGAKVSGELFRNGLLATALALLAVLAYIWFRFDWQFGVGLVTTLVLDITKTVGFFAVTRFEFDLNAIAALLILIGYSVTDKVVVYDRIRENLKKYQTMPLRPLIDLSINQTLGRTVATSTTVLLSILPLALIGGPILRGFACAIIFGIVVGTSSSIFIASPILLFLGEKRLRPRPAAIPVAGVLAAKR
jgi:preprotein translocase subunit SecF